MLALALYSFLLENNLITKKHLMDFKKMDQNYLVIQLEMKIVVYIFQAEALELVYQIVLVKQYI